jgi:hypothetical protein
LGVDNGDFHLALKHNKTLAERAAQRFIKLLKNFLPAVAVSSIKTASPMKGKKPPYISKNTKKEDNVKTTSIFWG